MTGGAWTVFQPCSEGFLKNDGGEIAEVNVRDALHPSGRGLDVPRCGASRTARTRRTRSTIARGRRGAKARVKLAEQP